MEETNDVDYNQAAVGMVDGVRDALIKAFELESASDSERQVASALKSADSKVGLGLMLSVMLPMIPGLENDPRVKQIAEAMRIEATKSLKEPK